MLTGELRHQAAQAEERPWHSHRRGQGEAVSPRLAAPQERCPLLYDWVYSGEMRKDVLKIGKKTALEPLLVEHLQQV